MSATRNSADPRLAELLRRLRRLKVPVLPDDHWRIRRVLPPGRRPSPETFEHTLVALLAKDAEQRRIVRREVQRLFGEDFEEERSDKSPPPASVTLGDTEPSVTTKVLGLAGPPGPAPTGSRTVGAPPPQVSPDRRVPLFGPALVLAAVAILIGAVGWWEARPQTSTEQQDNGETLPPPPISTLQAPAQTVPEHPIELFNTWVPVVTKEVTAAARPWWSASILLAVALAGLGWLLARGRDLSRPPHAAEQYRFEPSGRRRVLGWSADDRRLPPPLARDQRRELVWGVQHFTEDRPSPHLDAAATVEASARLARPEIRFAVARRTREVWLWRDQRLEDDQADALIDQIHRELTRAGLTLRQGSFTALPDTVHLGVDPEGRGRTRPVRASPVDLAADAREALVAIFTDGRGLASALESDPARAAGARRLLQELKSWPRCCLVDCSGSDLDLARLAKTFKLECIRPEQLTAWIAERPGGADARDEPTLIPDSDVLLWAACCALPAAPLGATHAQARELRDRLGLPPAWQLPEADPDRPGGGGPEFLPAERLDLLRRLADRLWHDAGDAEGLRRKRFPLALDFWRRALERVDPTTAQSEHDRDDVGQADFEDGIADHRLRLEQALLELWSAPDELDSAGLPRLAGAVKRLYDLDRLYAGQDGPGQVRRDALRERLNELSAADLGEPLDGASSGTGSARIHLPWQTAQIRELPDELPDTTLSRLYALGFAGAVPVDAGGRRPLGTEQHLMRGLLAGVAAAAAAALILHPPLPEPSFTEHWDYRVDDVKGLFRDLTRAPVIDASDGTRTLKVASRKVAEVHAASPGDRFRVHWCWTGAEPPPGAAADSPCRDLAEDNSAERRNVLLRRLAQANEGRDTKQTALLRAGTLAEPIRACADDWPQLSVAVIAADPWTYGPDDPDNNRPARQLAIQLLDSGAVDLALIGPGWAEEARALAERWSFADESQWLFFARHNRPSERTQARELLGGPSFGTHQGLAVADYGKLADRIAEARRKPTEDVADRLGDWASALVGQAQDLRVEGGAILTGAFHSTRGRPRLWIRPPVETVSLGAGQGIDLIQVCPGTFTMGATGLAKRRIPAIVEEIATATEDPFPSDALRQRLDATLGDSIADDDWASITDDQALIEAYTAAIEYDDERPAHPVLVDGFGIARTEHTSGQLAAGQAADREDQVNRPVANITWDDAREACRTIGRRRDLPTEAWDLPTESQWEYAARGGSRTAWSWGDDAASAGDYAWFEGNSDGSAHDVGQKIPNPLGLSDVHGNLWEWNRDCHDDKAYERRRDRLPSAEAVETADCRGRVRRGGAFNLVPRSLSSALRTRDDPELPLYARGFRCVRSGAPGP